MAAAGQEQTKKPAKPQKMNGFAMFMLENRKIWEEEGQAFPGGLRDVVGFADPMWRALSETERASYKEKATLKNAEASRMTAGRPSKPLLTTLGFRGPPAPATVIEKTRHGVGIEHEFPPAPEPQPARNEDNEEESADTDGDGTGTERNEASANEND